MFSGSRITVIRVAFYLCSHCPVYVKFTLGPGKGVGERAQGWVAIEMATAEVVPGGTESLNVGPLTTRVSNYKGKK